MWSVLGIMVFSFQLDKINPRTQTLDPAKGLEHLPAQTAFALQLRPGAGLQQAWRPGIFCYLNLFEIRGPTGNSIEKFTKLMFTIILMIIMLTCEGGKHVAYIINTWEIYIYKRSNQGLVRGTWHQHRIGVIDLLNLKYTNARVHFFHGPER